MDEEHELRRAIDDELYHLVMEEMVNEALQFQLLSEGRGKKYQNVKNFLDEGPIEFRALEEREVDKNEVKKVDKNEVKKVDDHEKVIQHKDDDLKGKQEIEIEDDHGGSIEGFHSECNDEEESNNGEDRSRTVLNDVRLKKDHYPLRPDAEDCSYYIRTGICKFGSTCKFNHPLKRRNQSSKETMKQEEENSERHGQMECKFYSSSGGCKYGNACRNIHNGGRNAVTPVVEYNFLGLPIRLGEKECAYYMRNGSCKYGPNCRFNHPDPTTAIEGGDSLATCSNSGPVQRTPTDFMPLLYSPTHNMPPPDPDWNHYLAPAPVYPYTESSLPTPPALVLNNLPCNTNLYTHHQQQIAISDFPERPGELECSYFMKTGHCKYKSACKFHHPKSRIPEKPPSVLSDKGLPLRPDQNICKHYSMYGICKYGPSCKYDHPPDQTNSGGYRPDQTDVSLTRNQVRILSL